jgi:hypothetical protein
MTQFMIAHLCLRNVESFVLIAEDCGTRESLKDQIAGTEEFEARLCAPTKPLKGPSSDPTTPRASSLYECKVLFNELDVQMAGGEPFLCSAFQIILLCRIVPEKRELRCPNVDH